LAYLKTLENKDRVTATIRGFGDTAKDYDIRVDNNKVGAGFEVTGDRPLSNVAFWSIRTALAVQPYIAMSIDPGSDFTWNLTYTYYTLSEKTK
jgi:subtilase family serine protease